MSRRYNIFISILAIAAAVSCTKSDIVGSMSTSTEIGFETYLGRDAQTKATVETTATLQNGGRIGIYGIYTGAKMWDGKTETNLLIDEELSYDKTKSAWTYTNTAFWTNDKDYYSFLAYAPHGNSAVSASQPAGKAPQLVYEVPGSLGSQVDIVYSNENQNTTKAACTKNGVTAVPILLQHALSRISVKANAVMYNETGGVFVPGVDEEYGNIFTVTNISIKGPFKTVGTFDLVAGDWIATTTTENTTYDLNGNVTKALEAEYYDFSANSNYLMIIPADFTTTKAKLAVTYTVTYLGMPSGEITKEVEIAENFEIGKAYSINLTFQRDSNNPITFKVNSLSQWEDQEINTPTSPVANS